jgi:hypothetical protein
MASIHLTPEQSQQWEEGGWLSLEIQETILEDIERQGITNVVAVVLSTGVVAFWVSAQRIL